MSCIATIIRMSLLLASSFYVPAATTTHTHCHSERSEEPAVPSTTTDPTIPQNHPHRAATTHTNWQSERSEEPAVLATTTDPTIPQRHPHRAATTQAHCHSERSEEPAVPSTTTDPTIPQNHPHRDPRALQRPAGLTTKGVINRSRPNPTPSQ